MFAGSIIINFWEAFIPYNQFTNSNPSAMGVTMGKISFVIGMIYLLQLIFIIVIHVLDRKNGRNGDNRVAQPAQDKQECRVVPSQT